MHEIAILYCLNAYCTCNGKIKFPIINAHRSSKRENYMHLIYKKVQKLGFLKDDKKCD